MIQRVQDLPGGLFSVVKHIARLVKRQNDKVLLWRVFPTDSGKEVDSAIAKLYNCCLKYKWAIPWKVDMALKFQVYHITKQLLIMFYPYVEVKET